MKMMIIIILGSKEDEKMEKEGQKEGNKEIQQWEGTQLSRDLAPPLLWLDSLHPPGPASAPEGPPPRGMPDPGERGPPCSVPSPLRRKATAGLLQVLPPPSVSAPPLCNVFIYSEISSPRFP